MTAMFNNPYYPQYVPMQMPQASTVPTPQQQPQSQSSSIIWVQGENAAKSFLVAPGQSVMLMDSEGDKFYLKSSDASGMPLPLRVFSYSEVTAPVIPDQSAKVEYVTRSEFDELSAKLDSIIAKQKRRKAEEAEDNG